MGTHNGLGASRHTCLAAGAALFGCFFIGCASAYETNLGDWQVNLDTTLSSSVDLRTSDKSQALIGMVNGGKLLLPNADDGSLNFRSGGPVAATQRITTELQIKRDDYGVFVRATGFYDPVIDSYRTDLQPLTRAAVRDIGADLRLLDAYAFARPSILGHPFDVRIGAQALNWGESTFIQFGINSINPLDVTALRTPGSELRQAFLPIPVVDIKTEIAPNTSLEGFWQAAWTRSRLEPKGSFFGTNDTLLDGGTYGLLRSDYPDSATSTLGVINAFGAALPRRNDRHPTSLDEFGFALRTTIPALNDAEIGLYFENYHSRIPFASYRTGSQNISGVPGPYAVLPYPITAFLTGAPYALKSYASTAGYFADYPKDIHLVGLSWNFNAPGGIAIQGEFSHRLNQPIQYAASDLSLAANVPALKTASPLSPLFAGAYDEALLDPAIQQLGVPAGFNQIIDGWKRFHVSQLQMTASKLFGAMPSLGINSVAVVGELGFDYVHDFPKARGVFNASYTTDINSAYTQAATVNGDTPLSRDGLTTQFSGAYVIAAVVDMPQVLPYGIDMKPSLSLQHDFVGTSPYGVNTFQENTAAASAGVTFNYLQAWSLGLQYTNHFPLFDRGKYYGLIDRDFFSASLSYEF